MSKHPKASATGRLRRMVFFGGMLIAAASEAAACGYHDDVALARGLLNWVYPDALHVVGAASMAVAERRLPAGAPAGLLGYHITVRALDRHAQQLRTPSGEMSPPRFSLLLIEPMLWTRFVPDGGDVRTEVHVSGPQAGDLVVISGEEVIRAVANDRLTVGEAYRSGLIRLYGTDEQVKSFVTLYDEVGSRLAP